MKSVTFNLSSTLSTTTTTLSGTISAPKVKNILKIDVTPPIPEENIVFSIDNKKDEIKVTLNKVSYTQVINWNFKLGYVEDRDTYRLCWYNLSGSPSGPWNAQVSIDLDQSCPLTKTSKDYVFSYNVTITYEDNASPSIDLTTSDQQVLTDGQIYRISGSAFDPDSGNRVTVKYRLNNQQERIIMSEDSNGSTPLPFSKMLTIRNGQLYDGIINISSQLIEGVFHTLNVWAEDNNGVKSPIITRSFKIVLPVKIDEPAPMYRGSIAASNDFLRAMKNPIKQLYIKLEFFDSKMNFISEFTRQVSSDDIGAITVDMNSPVRRSFSFSLDNYDNMFAWGEDRLLWIDKRIKIFIGLRLPYGSIEYIPQGVFIVSDPQDSHTFDGKKIYITGRDKMWLMTDKRGKFLYTTKIESGLNIGAALKIIASKAGETLFNFDDIQETIPYELTYSPDDNLYKALEELSILAKGTIYYDVYGYLRFKKIDLNAFENTPVTWSYKYGDSHELFYAGNIRSLDESNLANHIVVLGGSGQTAISSFELIVDENNPIWKTSPYVFQKIGRITHFHNNGSPDSLLTSNEECKWRAKYELMKRLGYTERVSLNVAPVYLHDAGEVIEIEDEQNLVKGKYLLERFSVPINPSMMTCECLKYRKVIDDWDFI